MKLKKIDIRGFKSFADKTRLTFHDGITCIVGPNGCGKSNIVDVTKWILGEQSVKSLRGKEMTDVIFNGTTTRKAHGYAEATMTLDNEDRLLNIDMDEVQVTRRVHRTGEGEYFINQQPVRLKDIKELFMDTGVGTKSYSVMEQGQIEVFINSSSKDRRKLFEEAAGISRYKSKKDEATRKLDRVEQNLLRINDIIDEVESRLKSVTLQAQKAKRYQALVDELKKFRVSHSVLYISDLNKITSVIQADIQKCENNLAEVMGKLSKIDADSSRIEKNRNDVEIKIQSAEGERATFKASVAELETNQSWSKRNIQELGAETDLLQKEVDGSKEKIKNEAEIIGECEKLSHDLEIKIESKSVETIQIEEQRNRLQEEIKTLIESVDSKKQDILRRMNEKIQLESEISRLKAENQMISSRKTEIEEANLKIDVVLKDIELRYSSNTQQLEKVTSSKGSVSASLDQNKKSLIDVENKIYGIEKEINELSQKNAVKENRLQLLQDLEDRNEGLTGGVKSVLKALKENNNIGSLRGIIADLFTVESKYALAIETFMGFRAQEIVTDTAEDAKKAIEFLKENRKGRCTFIPLDSVKSRSEPDKEILKKEGVLGIALDLISFDKEYKNVMSRLLGQVFIVDNIDNAIAITKGSNIRSVLVTLDGEVFSADGAISGGTKRDAGGIITRKNEIIDIKKDLIDIKKSLKDQLDDLDTQKESRKTSFQLVDSTTSELHDLNIQLSRLNSEKQEIEREKDGVVQNQTQNISRVAEYASSVEVSSKRIIEIDNSLKDLEKFDTNIEEDISEQETALRTKEVDLAKYNNDVTNAKLDLSGLKEKKSRAENEKALYEKHISEQRDRINKDDFRIEVNTKRLKDLEIKVLKIEGDLEKRLKENLQQEGEIKDLFIQREEFRNLLANVLGSSDGLRKDERKSSDELNNHKMKLYESEVKSTAVKDRIWEDYRINVDEFIKEASEEEMAEIKSSEYENLEEIIISNERKIKNIGPVNIDAIQEQVALEERFDFLSNQRNDLVYGKNSLTDVIDEINVVSRELFVKTFEEIRSSFQEMFRRLFGGGRADIVLQEGVDVLEAGIEIFAKPPGKENRSISLLSGGEKVMTTISLLFAVFKTKPSPFCILDEIDAALDEANVDRFMAVLQEFLSFTQFIIISHNRRTMTMSDEIYGVTMEEKGVSKVLTMSLDTVSA